MYAYFKGIIAQKEEDGLILEVNQIGYHIFMPGSMLDALPGVGQEAMIHTYTYIKEDAMQLYGFLSRDDLALFKMLITVSGIGPKGGLAVLSTLSADDLRFAILSEDAKAIAKAPGIGAKTAQKVVIELKDKISLEEALDMKKAHIETRAAGQSGAMEEAVEALVALGYSSTDALRAVRSVEHAEEKDAEALLKEALRMLAAF